MVDAARYEKEQNWLGTVLTPTAHALVKTEIDLSLDRFKSFIRYGKIHWKNGNTIEKPPEWFYIKPYQMADEDWAAKYLPTYFTDHAGKIENSHNLYGHE